MNARQHKYSVILNNYMKPSDRFMAGGYAATPDTRRIVDLIDLAGRQGVVEGLELLMGDEYTAIGINEANQGEVKAALEANGLALCGVTPNLWGRPSLQRGTLGSADPAIRRASLEMCKRAMDIAAECGGSYLGLWPGQDGYDYFFEADYPQVWEWWVEGVRTLADHNPAIRIGLEPKPEEPRAFSFISSVPKTLLLIEDIDRENVGLCLDIGHSLYSHENIGEAVALVQSRGSKLFHLHMNDNYNTSDLDMVFGSVHTLEFIEMFYWLRRTGYNRFMSVDLFAYRTNPEQSVEQSVRWMMAFDSFVDRVGVEKLGHLIAESDPIRSTAFFREQLFGC